MLTIPLTDKECCVRIQKMNAQADTPIKPKEYEVLDAISQDSMITQSGLASHLGIAVGSVNWYIKRLVSRGYVKVSRMDRTRLQYNLTPEGMTVFTERAMQYAKDSLKIYKSFRQKAQSIVSQLKADGITEVNLVGDDEIMDILQLTCVEAGLLVSDKKCEVTISSDAQKYDVFLELMSKAI
ncbi:MAG: winged helix-turn-helix transcriptional regulator [Chloroflexi bacterium]|nr:winged helix-turn-helix transcriptional regulator [Chloroflexota bacterium]